MCGKVSPFRGQLSIHLWRLRLPFQEGGIASTDKEELDGKAEPFPTSSGKAASEKIEAAE